jgi:hypothetical protein
MLLFLEIVNIDALMLHWEGQRTPVMAARLSIRNAVAKVDIMLAVFPLPTAHFVSSFVIFSMINYNESAAASQSGWTVPPTPNVLVTKLVVPFVPRITMPI